MRAYTVRNEKSAREMGKEKSGNLDSGGRLVQRRAREARILTVRRTILLPGKRNQKRGRTGVCSGLILGVDRGQTGEMIRDGYQVSPTSCMGTRGLASARRG